MRYKEWTDEPLLRHPVFLRFRDDKSPEECIRQMDIAPPEDEIGAAPTPPVGRRRNVVLSNQDKMFWPEERYTKGDLVEYYRAISPWLLPYLAERPVVLTRFPDGITGKSFYQKDAPVFTPDWLRTERMWSEATQREIDYFVADDVPSLLYLANLASIPLHIWLSRVGSLELPDWCVIDLDPKGAPFADVVRIAQASTQLCDEIGLPHYAKTSGSTGIHVLIPLARQLTYEQSRSFGELLSRVVVARLPEIATVVRAVQRGTGRSTSTTCRTPTGS